MNRRSAYLIAATALCLAMSACGNKGPLVLPDKPADGTSTDGTPAEGTPAQPTPADSGDKTPDH